MRWVSMSFSLTAKQKASNKEILFYEDNEDCPTCQQTIESSFRLDKVQNAKDKWDELEEARQQCEHQIGKLTNDKEDLQDSIDSEIENGMISTPSKKKSHGHKDELLLYRVSYPNSKQVYIACKKHEILSQVEEVRKVVSHRHKLNSAEAARIQQRHNRTT